MDAHIFLNGQPYALWLQEGAPSEEWKERYTPPLVAKSQPAAVVNNVPSNNPSVSANLMSVSATRMRIFTPESLALLQRQNQDAIDRMVKAMEAQAHSIAYVPPVFIGFRQSASELFFQTSLAAAPEARATNSRPWPSTNTCLISYVRRWTSSPKTSASTDWTSAVLSTSATDRRPSRGVLLFRMMRRFASYDCTGQQLLDSGTVVINGERSARSCKSPKERIDNRRSKQNV